MSWKASTGRYGAVAIFIHWVSAAAILAMFALGFMAANAADPTTQAALLRFHVPLGLIVLILTVLRLLWWLVDRRPAPLADQPRWQITTERMVRILIYVAILIMGASGIALVVLSGAGAILFFGAPGPLPDFWHFAPMRGHLAAAIVLLALAGLHIVAALHHQFYRRDRLLARMGLGARDPVS